MNFAMTGVGGYIAPRHLEAIAAVGGRVISALDPHDSVGILDRYGMHTEFFTEYERFERSLEGAKTAGNAADWMTVCSPNYLHDAHIRLGLRTGSNVICEKPLVISPWNLDALKVAEKESGKRVFTILQLRHHHEVIKMKQQVEEARREYRPLMEKGAITDALFDVQVSYITPRGPWYSYSWKGHEGKSGGVAMNIGVHLFDVLAWVFGKPTMTQVHLREPSRVSGITRFESAVVKWFLSTSDQDLPGGMKSFREFSIERWGKFELSDGFTELHTEAYKAILAGQGFGIDDARPSIELVHQIRGLDVSESCDGLKHPFAR